MSDYAILDDLADPLALVGADVRLAIARSIETLLAAHHTVSAASLRPALLNEGWARDLLDKRMGGMLNSALRKGVIKWTGEYVASGNAASRNDQRPVKVYTYGPRGAPAVWDWVDTYQADRARTHRTLQNLKDGGAQ